MRLATWNVNSIRARKERLLSWLAKTQPDVVCLQEIKCSDTEFPQAEIEAAGYQAVWHGQRTYNGVAILAKANLTDVRRGLGDGGDDSQSRVISAHVLGLRVFSIYAPNGQEVGSTAYQFKLEWYARLRTHLEKSDAVTGPLVVAGDFNVAPDARDVWDAQALEGQTLFTLPEREALAELLKLGLVDGLRLHHEQAGLFTWWDYRMLGFPKNHGMRIDHVLLSESARSRCTQAGVERDERKGKQPSDHAPVWVELH
ncbi:MAG: exodeoxyribonuclease III [Myxococcaceae bacterium]